MRIILVLVIVSFCVQSEPFCFHLAIVSTLVTEYLFILLYILYCLGIMSCTQLCQWSDAAVWEMDSFKTTIKVQGLHSTRSW